MGIAHVRDGSLEAPKPSLALGLQRPEDSIFAAALSVWTNFVVAAEVLRVLCAAEPC